MSINSTVASPGRDDVHGHRDVRRPAQARFQLYERSQGKRSGRRRQGVRRALHRVLEEGEAAGQRESPGLSRCGSSRKQWLKRASRSTLVRHTPPDGGDRSVNSAPKPERPMLHHRGPRVPSPLTPLRQRSFRFGADLPKDVLRAAQTPTQGLWSTGGLRIDSRRGRRRNHGGASGRIEGPC